MKPTFLFLRCLAAAALFAALESRSEELTAQTPPSDHNPSETFWAFRPPADPPVPAAQNTPWARTPLDHFILAALERQNLAPSPPADKRALLRRAAFDLTGLPPTTEEMQAFLDDASPRAFARVVDRLLGSFHYGERWGRRWLDVARYADSNGMDENAAHGNAWRYRDYVIASFNRDKPFDQFLIEQIAGDLLQPSAPPEIRHEHLTALGFLAIGPKVLAEPDKTKMELDIIDEQIDALGRAVCGITIACARCHDHKFDPISTEDYYGLVAIFKSTRTMDDLKTIAKWHEPLVATAQDQERLSAHQARLAAQKTAVSNFVAEANLALLTSLKTNALPAKPETLYPASVQEQLKSLRAALTQLEAELPELPSTMGVTEATNILKTFPVLMRGNYLTPGPEIQRQVPKVMAGGPLAFSDQQSGRLELARWLASPSHPLTARVMVNRIWRWHFGAGIVPTTDNFGRLGEQPTHPEMLDWLAHRFIESGWSIKAMHRLIMNSAVYQQSTGQPPSLSASNQPPAAAPDAPDPRWLSRFPVRRLEAEEIRDSILTVSGLMDWTAGGRTMTHKNRILVFDHTSTDQTTYTSKRRSVYLPVIRNNVYDVFELLDFPDPAQPVGDRATTTVAAQALFFMNSDLLADAADALAKRLLEDPALDDADRVAELYWRGFARPPTPQETARAAAFLSNLPQTSPGPPSSGYDPRRHQWSALCQVIMSSNEFIFLE